MSNLFNMTCDIVRLASTADHRSQRTPVVTGAACMLIPSDSETAVGANIELSRAYDIFFAIGQNVRVSDKVIIDGIEYYIRAKQEFKNAGDVSHIRCIAEIKDVKE